MMFQDREFRLARIKEVQAQVLELPYAGEELSMLVLLPDDHVPLSLVSVLRALPARLALEPLLPLLGVLARVPEHIHEVMGPNAVNFVF